MMHASSIVVIIILYALVELSNETKFPDKMRIFQKQLIANSETHRMCQSLFLLIISSLLFLSVHFCLISICYWF